MMTVDSMVNNISWTIKQADPTILALLGLGFVMLGYFLLKK